MKKTLLFLIGLIILIISCDDDTSFLPKSKFVGNIQLKPRNPAKLLSENFSVRDLQFEGQDQKYTIRYNKEKNFTTLINILSDDTLFQGFAYKNKDIWYFKYQLTDSTFWLSAIKTEGEFIEGWPISWAQMYQVDTLVEKMDFDTLTTIYDLEPSKKNLHNIYQLIFSNPPKKRYELIKQPSKFYEKMERPTNRGKNIISNITPNMEEGYIDISLKKSGNYSFDFLKKEGGLVQQFKLIDKDFIHIDVSDFDEGFYIMETNDSDTGKLLVRSEIYIK